MILPEPVCCQWKHTCSAAFTRFRVIWTWWVRSYSTCLALDELLFLLVQKHKSQDVPSVTNSVRNTCSAPQGRDLQKPKNHRTEPKCHMLSVYFRFSLVFEIAVMTSHDTLSTMCHAASGWHARRQDRHYHSWPQPHTTTFFNAQYSLLWFWPLWYHRRACSSFEKVGPWHQQVPSRVGVSDHPTSSRAS